jgi:speckle-type POZ protein
VGGHEWVLLFYPDGKRSTNDPNNPPPNDDPYAALFVALIGEGPRPQGVVQSISGRVVRAFHRFTLVDQSGNNRDITKGRQRDQGAVKISCARQDPNARNCHGYRKFVRRSVLEAPNNGYLVDDTIVIRYEIELVVTSGGALNRQNKQNPACVEVDAFPTLGDQVRSMMTDDADKTDCVFEVEGERFPAHSLVVAARSSTFRAMLRTGAEMREGTEGVIRLQDIRAPVFKILLGFIYSDELPDGTGRGTYEGGAAGGRLDGPGAGAARHHSSEDAGSQMELDVAMVQHLLVAADRFDVTRLRAICEARLCEMMEVETAATTLALAEQSRAQALKGACLDFIAANLADVMLTDGFKHMEVSCPQLAGELLKAVALYNQQTAASAAHAAPLPPTQQQLGGLLAMPRAARADEEQQAQAAAARNRQGMMMMTERMRTEPPRLEQPRAEPAARAEQPVPHARSNRASVPAADVVPAQPVATRASQRTSAEGAAGGAAGGSAPAAARPTTRRAPEPEQIDDDELPFPAEGYAVRVTHRAAPADDSDGNEAADGANPATGRRVRRRASGGA